jgi:hypothetical protein
MTYMFQRIMYLEVVVRVHCTQASGELHGINYRAVVLKVVNLVFGCAVHLSLS